MKQQPIVYVIDDDPAMLHGLATLIELTGFEAKAYASATEFLETYQPTSPACLVLDVRLPGMSGFELQRELAKRGCPPPIVFITGNAGLDVAAEAMDLGAVAFLEKPFQAQELLDSVRQAIAMDEENRQGP